MNPILALLKGADFPCKNRAGVFFRTAPGIDAGTETDLTVFFHEILPAMPRASGDFLPALF